MPNLVVYVPADVARALEALGVPQNIQRKACQEVLVGLANGGLEAGGGREKVGRRVSPDGAVQTAGHASSPASSPSSATGTVRDEPGQNSNPGSGGGGSPRPRTTSCPGYVPAGVRCKLCGQVHQPKGRKS